MCGAQSDRGSASSEGRASPWEAASDAWVEASMSGRGASEAALPQAATAHVSATASRVTVATWRGGAPSAMGRVYPSEAKRFSSLGHAVSYVARACTCEEPSCPCVVPKLTSEGETVTSEKGAAFSEGEAITSEKGGPFGEGEAIASAKGGRFGERDAIASEKGGPFSERDAIASAMGGLFSEGDAIPSEKRGLFGEREGLVAAGLESGHGRAPGTSCGYASREPCA